MRYLLCILALVVLISCDTGQKKEAITEISKENPAKEKAIAAWTDSLLRATSEVSLYARGLSPMSITQKRMPEKYHLEKSVKVHLVGDTLKTTYYSAHVDALEGLGREIEQSLYPDLLKEMGISEDIPLTVFIGIDSCVLMGDVLRVLKEFQQLGYFQICFGGVVTDQPNLPSIPDTAFYHKIQDALKDSPQAAFMEAYASFAEKEVRRWRPAKQIFDSLAFIPGLYPKIEFQAQRYPEALQAYDKSDRLLSLLYFLVRPYSFPAREHTAVRAFTMSSTGDVIRCGEDQEWKDVARELFNEEGKCITFSIQ